jgi:hypothetical protein
MKNPFCNKTSEVNKLTSHHTKKIQTNQTIFHKLTELYLPKKDPKFQESVYAPPIFHLYQNKLNSNPVFYTTKCSARWTHILPSLNYVC